MFTNQTLLKDRFAFSKTVGQILTSAGKTADPVTKGAMVRTLLDTTSAVKFSNAGVEMKVDPRAEAVELSAEDLLGSDPSKNLFPTAVFNRLDLAPKNWEDCGEYRVVYARRPVGIKRFLLIFEARLPSELVPNSLTPVQRQARCQLVARFWSDLAKESDQTKVVDALENFYFKGLKVGAEQFPPVISAANLGQELGQVRGNLFMQVPWQLREWLIKDTGTKLVFKPETVKSNPLAEFYANPPADAVPLTLRHKEFQSEFLSRSVRELLTPELEGKSANVTQLTERIAMNNSDKFNEFQSDSLGQADNPRLIAKSEIRNGIQAVLQQIGTPANGVTVDHILNRASAVTCSGCHQISREHDLGANKVPIAPGKNWPLAHREDFVHVFEKPLGGNSELSAALTDHFLLSRMQGLKKMLCGDVSGPEIQMTTMALEGNAKVIGELKKSIRVSVDGLRTEKDAVKSQAASVSIDAAVEKLREAARSAPGAFRSVRPVH